MNYASRNLVVLVALWFLSPLTARAQSAGPPGITLFEAVQHTLDKHPLLAIQQREVDMNRGAKQQATSRFDTTIQVSGSQSRSNSPLTVYQRDQAALYGITTSNQASNTTDYSAGAQRLLRSGILVSPSLSLYRNTDNLTVQNGVNQSHLLLQVVLPLARNRGRDIVTAQETAAQLGVDASLYDLAETAAELISNTVIAYWNYVAANKALGVLRGSELRGRALVENVQILIDADRLPKSEMYDVTANLADRVTSRIAAEQQVIQARQALAVAMGLGADEITRVPPPADDFPDGITAQAPSTEPNRLKEYVERALAGRADYLAAKKRQDSAAVLLRAADNQLRPQIDLTLSSGYSGLNEGRRPDRFLGAAFTGVGGADVIAGLRYTFPLENNYAKGQLLQASASHRQTELRYADLGRTIASDVVVTATGVGNSIVRLKSAHETVVAFDSALEGERDKLRLGVGSLVDILTIEDRLTSALNNQVSAQLSYAASLIRFRFATGTIIAPDRAAQSVDPDVLVSSPFVAPGPPK